jgi:hypothetical protein
MHRWHRITQFVAVLIMLQLARLDSLSTTPSYLAIVLLLSSWSSRCVRSDLRQLDRKNTGTGSHSVTTGFNEMVGCMQSIIYCKIKFQKSAHTKA